MKTETKRTVAAKLMLFSSAVIWGSSFFILKNTLDELPVYFAVCKIPFLGNTFEHCIF